MEQAVLWGLFGLAATLCLGNTVLVACVCCVVSAVAGTAFELPVPSSLGGGADVLPWLVGAEYLVIAVASVLAYRVMRYGRSMRPKRERLARVRVMVWAARHLPASPPAIEGPAGHPFAEVDWMRRCAHLNHPQADRCSLPRRAHPVPGVVLAAGEERIRS